MENDVKDVKERNIKELTDIELGVAQGNLYTELMKIQNSLIAVSNEIQLRSKLRFDSK